MMANNNNGPRDSQQDRRVYVGNLSYDVKWHHLKDHMKAGKFHRFLKYDRELTFPPRQHSGGAFRRRSTTS